MKNPFTQLELWFVTGSQHLYGPETLKQVAANSDAIVRGMNQDARLPIKLVGKGVMKSPEEVRAMCLEANSSDVDRRAEISQQTDAASAHAVQ
jgi:L-arabinose isomerase